MRTYAPEVQWDPKVGAYLGASLGHAKLQQISKALCRPSLSPALRVNTLRTNVQDAQQRLKQTLNLTKLPEIHPQLPYVLQLHGQGPAEIEYDTLCGDREVVINRRAAEAVLRGANVYSPGLLAASRGLAPGDKVAVSVALELPGRNWCGINRGAVVQPADASARSHLFVGTARCEIGRRQMFRDSLGLALTMEDRVWDIPAVHGVMKGEVMLQALPSIVAAAALSPAPGSTVLDCCASPGGKATMIAQLMQGTGRVVALDRTHAKVQRIRDLATDLGLNNVEACKADATRILKLPGSANDLTAPLLNLDAAVSEDNDDSDELEAGISTMSSSSGQESSVMFEPESFDAVLLDVPCSALGLRPRLVHANWSLPRLRDLASYQRALLHTAVHALKPGGHLVYSTCTFNPCECEANVRWALDKFGHSLQLEPALPLVGGPGLIGQDPETGEEWLRNSDEASMVQRFDPSDPDTDTIGFFVARFVKTRSV